MAGALLIASIVNFVIVFGERHRAIFIESTSGVINRYAEAAHDVVTHPLPPNGPEPSERTRRSRYVFSDASLVDAVNLPRDRGVERRLISSLIDNGVPNPVVRAATRTVVESDETSRRLIALMQQDVPRMSFVALPVANDEPSLEILLTMQLPDGRWYNSMTYQPETARGDAAIIGASTLITFIFVLGAALWIASRLSRPLNELASAAARVGDSGETQQVVVRGPGDVQRTIAAFNAMSLRVSQLLREKDVMLGALGHDLRTPLASLRIRIETMEPESERLKAVRTIEEASDLLEDILELSRRGASREPERTMDLAVVAEDTAEDYVETGAPVAIGTMQKAITSCRPVLFRRALRNLIDNAITYGGNARVSAGSKDGFAFVYIEDDGPGMETAALTEATQPFYRGEVSRNRGTGGAGLGLTLAEAIARAHGGELILENRMPHGLRATLRLPLPSKT